MTLNLRKRKSWKKVGRNKLDTVKSIVSNDRVRYVDGTHNLDLTYITPNIVAMAFPASGLEKVWRNSVEDVCALLRKNHGKNFKIWNLAERATDEDEFDHRVKWMPFVDHHPPPLSLLCKIVDNVSYWLQCSDDHIAVVHCIGGKGRTGTIISSYLFYSGLCLSAEMAIHFFGERRSSKMHGVTQPSQLRYVHYFESLVRGNSINIQPVALKAVSICPLPMEKDYGLEVYDSPYNGNMIYSNYGAIQGKNGAIYFHIDMDVCGDLYFRFVSKWLGITKAYFHIGLHTYFLDQNQYTFDIKDLDNLQKNNFPPDMQVTIVFDKPKSREIKTIIPELQPYMKKYYDKRLREGIVSKKTTDNNPLLRKNKNTLSATAGDSPEVLNFSVGGDFDLNRRAFVLRKNRSNLYKKKKQQSMGGSSTMQKHRRCHSLDQIIAEKPSVLRRANTIVGIIKHTPLDTPKPRRKPQRLKSKKDHQQKSKSRKSVEPEESSPTQEPPKIKTQRSRNNSRTNHFKIPVSSTLNTLPEQKKDVNVQTLLLQSKSNSSPPITKLSQMNLSQNTRQIQQNINNSEFSPIVKTRRRLQKRSNTMAGISRPRPVGLTQTPTKSFNFDSQQNTNQIPKIMEIYENKTNPNPNTTVIVKKETYTDNNTTTVVTTTKIIRSTSEKISVVPITPIPGRTILASFVKSTNQEGSEGSTSLSNTNKRSLASSNPDRFRSVSNMPQLKKLPRHYTISETPTIIPNEDIRENPIVWTSPRRPSVRRNFRTSPVDDTKKNMS